MKNLDTVRERYLRDPLPVRLGGLAANLSRMASFARNPANSAVVDGLFEESKYFIEWTIRDAQIEEQAELVQLQVQLAVWHRRWLRDFLQEETRTRLAQNAKQWSRRALLVSGLIPPPRA